MSPKPKPDFTMNSVWDLLADEIAKAPQPRPADSVTAEEFAAKTDYSVTQANRKLRDLVAAGRLKAQPYLTENRKRGVCYVNP